MDFALLDTNRATFVAPEPTATATVTATATATATPTATQTAPQPQPAVCRVLAIRINTPTIRVQERGSVTISNAEPNSIIELYAYSRPSTTFRLVREAEAGTDGSATFSNLVPPTNTRLFGLQRGCDRATFGGDDNNPNRTAVINVRTALGLTAIREGRRTYRFEGRLLPQNQRTLVTLYRIDRNGREILSAQDFSNPNNQGIYRIRRVFTGSGTFDFVARTSQTLNNAPGVSNVRPTLIF